MRRNTRGDAPSRPGAGLHASPKRGGAAAPRRASTFSGGRLPILLEAEGQQAWIKPATRSASAGTSMVAMMRPPATSATTVTIRVHAPRSEAPRENSSPSQDNGNSLSPRARTANTAASSVVEVQGPPTRRSTGPFCFIGGGRAVKGGGHNEDIYREV